MKSAIELAMARLDQEGPVTKISAEQKRRLAEIDSEITAKVAEKKVFLHGEIAKAGHDLETKEALQRQLSSELARLEEKREDKKRKVRAESSAS